VEKGAILNIQDSPFLLARKLHLPRVGNSDEKPVIPEGQEIAEGGKDNEADTGSRG
jgi:hypothetical protein